MPELPNDTLKPPRPFSVLRADLGAWQNRKRVWTELGLDSQRGREHVSLYDTRSQFARNFLRPLSNGLSTFDPVLAEMSYTWYCPPGGRILDPFAGGSVRGLVAGNLGYHYTGIDLSAAQIDANRDQARDWAARDLLAATVTWIHGDAAEVLPDLPAGGFDYVLTCPPYHNLERYSRHPADLSAMTWRRFRAAYTAIVAASVNCLAEHRFATWVVSDIRGSNGILRGLPALTSAAHDTAGARPYNDAVLMTVIGTTSLRLAQQWTATRKMGRHHQYVLTFIKGNARTATAAIATADASADSRA